jgi:hypothetical protein
VQHAQALEIGNWHHLLAAKQRLNYRIHHPLF